MYFPTCRGQFLKQRKQFQAPNKKLQISWGEQPRFASKCARRGKLGSETLMASSFAFLSLLMNDLSESLLAKNYAWWKMNPNVTYLNGCIRASPGIFWGFFFWKQKNTTAREEKKKEPEIQSFLFRYPLKSKELGRARKCISSTSPQICRIFSARYFRLRKGERDQFPNWQTEFSSLAKEEGTTFHSISLKNGGQFTIPRRTGSVCAPCENVKMYPEDEREIWVSYHLHCSHNFCRKWSECRVSLLLSKCAAREQREYSNWSHVAKEPSSRLGSCQLACLPNFPPRPFSRRGEEDWKYRDQSFIVARMDNSIDPRVPLLCSAGEKSQKATLSKAKARPNQEVLCISNRDQVTKAGI